MGDGTRWDKFAQDLGVSSSDMPKTVVWHPSESVHHEDEGSQKSTGAIIDFLNAVSRGDVDPKGSGAGVMATLQRTMTGIVDSIGPIPCSRCPRRHVGLHHLPLHGL